MYRHRILIILAMLLVVNGCATTSQKQANTTEVGFLTEEQKIIDYYTQRIGRWTYDDAIAKFGRPTEFAKGVEVFVATWKNEETHMRLVDGWPVIVKEGGILRLTFSKENGLLVDFRYIPIEPDPSRL